MRRTSEQFRRTPTKKLNDMNRFTLYIAKTLALLAITLLQVNQVFATDCCCRHQRGGEGAVISQHDCCGKVVSASCGATSTVESCCNRPGSGPKPCQCPSGCGADDTVPAVEADECSAPERDVSALAVLIQQLNAVVLPRTSLVSRFLFATSGLRRCVLLCRFRL